MKKASIKAQHVSVPSIRKQYCYKRETPGKLNRESEYDTGGVYSLTNIYTGDYPLISSANGALILPYSYTGKVLDFTMCDGVIYAALYRDGKIYLSEYDIQNNTFAETYICESQDSDPEHYALVRYNEFSSYNDPINGTFAKKILLLPLFCSGEIDGGGDSVFSSASGTPLSSVATVFMSRLFSACGGKLFASEFNNVNGYCFDTADSSSSANAWMSNTQSNVKSDGNITALAVYDGHVVVFKRDYMMQVYNNENPFRLVDIGAYGCISKRAVCEFDGKLAFIGPRGVMLYSGGYPYLISDELGIKDWEGSMLCASGNYLYVYVGIERCVYVYDRENACWGHREVFELSFMCGDYTGAYYVRNGDIVRFDGGEAEEFSIITDRSSLEYSGKKRISEIGCVAILKEGASLDIELVDERGAVYASVCVSGEGEHIISEKIKGVSLNFAQLVFSGDGEVKIGEYWIKYRGEDN